MKINKKKIINRDLFINNLTKEATYILGLLWADGNLVKRGRSRAIRLNMIESDIETIKIVFNKTGNWSFSHPVKKYHKNKQVKSQTTVSSSDWVLYDYLKSKNYEIKSKSDPEAILSTIPNELLKFWYRGYLDGDGCIRVQPSQISVVFASSHDQNWQFLINLCDFYGFKYYIYQTTNHLGGYSHFIIYRKNDVKNFCDFIYDDFRLDNIGLPRKHQKYLELSQRFDINNKNKI